MSKSLCTRCSTSPSPKHHGQPPKGRTVPGNVREKDPKVLGGKFQIVKSVFHEK